VVDKTPDALRNQFGIAIAGQTCERYLFLLDWSRLKRIFNAGARCQGLLWAKHRNQGP
jgi:hypothetical protein